MNELDEVYLIASFPDASTLKQAVRALQLPANHLRVLGSKESGAAALADELEVGMKLNHDVQLDDAQRERARWFKQNDARPLLAVQVMAEQGRELRQRLVKLGGEMITAPTISDQVNDASFDPGMGEDEPDLPPGEDRIHAPN